MKTITSILSTMAALALAILSASAQTPVTYTGTGNADGGGGNGTAISSVVVNNNANNITFTINSTTAQNFLMYGIELQVIGQAANGFTGLSQPFGESFGISSGVNAAINTFGTGATAYTANNAGYTSSGSVLSWVGGTGNTFATITASLSSLGLSVGQSFYLDVVSTFPGNQNGFPQSAYGALDSVTGFPAEQDGLFHPYNPDGHATFYDSANTAQASGSTFGTAATMYTVQAVPEPATCTLMGLGALVMIRRVFSRNAK
jgi:hypothetical protein